jgi:outer membrane protein assembly factor BamB
MIRNHLSQFVLLVLVCTASALGASWPMKHRDMAHTGRADFVVPSERMNDTFFDSFLWQKRTPGSPGEGNLSSTSMVFFDGAGPAGADIVVAGYHWPKGVQAMNRHNGKFFWAGNPGGGETIGTSTPAFANDGSVIYVVNDATADSTFPNGHPLMAFHTTVGPSTFRHNGADANPDHLSMHSPTIAPDGRIFLHAWVDRPYAGTDNGSAITETWAAATAADCGLGDASLYVNDGQLMVVVGSRWGQIKAYDGTTGEELWTAFLGATVDADVTIDPANGNIYVGCGSDSICCAGLDKYGYPLWLGEAMPVYEYRSGVNNPQRAQSAGCLSHDGATYYFQTNSQQGDGQLYAINTADGFVKWSYPTGSTGWEFIASSPVVTPNGVIVVGNNDGKVYYAIRDDGTQGTLLDTLAVDTAGNARATPTIAPDGTLYLPLRTLWVAGNGDGESPTYQTENLFSAIDLTAGAASPLWPPNGQAAIALNHAVAVSWQSVVDPNGRFHHYAIYRSTASFTSVAGMTPISSVNDINTTSYIDQTALNGVHYYYGVTTVDIASQEITDVNSVGPRTPRDETDLQVLSLARSPQYPRYLPNYTYYMLSEPSGFGPYGFSAATSLGGGQTADTQRWPNVGDTVTYTATVRNRGTNTWSGKLTATWTVDGAVVGTPSQTVTLAPGATATFAMPRTWEGLAVAHDIGFAINPSDARNTNNTLTVNTKAVPFLTYVDRSYIENFRENTAGSYPQAQTDDMIDWLQRHMARFNEMFAAANCQKRVHYNVLEVLDDAAPDPAVDRTPYAIFPFRYHATDGDARLSGYYNRTDDIDYGLLHEMGHQLGLIDIYQFDVPPEANQVSGQGYSSIPDLMHGCSPVISQHSALAMNHWLDKAHGYYGQYLYGIPAEMRLRILDINGKPLPGATVKMYQYCERPGQGKVITNQIKAQGTTDANGEFVLPNVPVDPGIVPTTYAGDTLQANPFGYVAVVGTNGVLHFRVEYNGGVDYAWLDITEANVAYYTGQTDSATFVRQLGLGGTTQLLPPNDMTEFNATDWSAWAQGSDSAHTYVQDDTTRKLVGGAALKFITDGGFDTYVRYPRTFVAQWDLSSAQYLKVSFYAVNPSPIGFQSGSPWIRLKDADNNYFEYQYFQNGGPVDLLNQARNTWRRYQIPLNASSTEQNGWRRTAVGSPNLAHIQYVEIHADTWDAGFTLWLDGVGFDPPLRRPGDADGDADVDLADFTHFQSCFNGPNRPAAQAACTDADFDTDQDVDLNDFLVFQGCFNGPNRPAACPG